LFFAGTLHDIYVLPNDTVKVTSEISHALHLKCVDVLHGNVPTVDHSDETYVTRGCDAHGDVMSSAASDVEKNVSNSNDEALQQSTAVSLQQSTAVSDASHMANGGSPDELFYVNRESVGKLNNVHLNNSCVSSLGDLKRRFHHDAGSKFKLAVMAKDLFLFPIYCLRIGLVDEVCFIGLNHLRRKIVDRLLDLNGINSCRVLFQHSNTEYTSMNNYQVLWVDIIHSSGSMQQNILEDIRVAR
jgi:hypothetical protein